MDDLEFVPDTPSPILNRKQKSCNSQKPNYGRVLKDNNFASGKDSEQGDETASCKTELSMPGQNGFAKERQEAIKRKKEREHLSPFKSKHAPSCSSTKISPTKISPSVTKVKNNLLGGFVKSSELLKTDHCNAALNRARNGHKVYTKSKTSKDMGVSDMKAKGKKKRSLGWPSSSGSSSDEEDKATAALTGARNRLKVYPKRKINTSEELPKKAKQRKTCVKKNFVGWLSSSDSSSDDDYPGRLGPRSPCHRCKRSLSPVSALAACTICSKCSVKSSKDAANADIKHKQMSKSTSLQTFTRTKSSTVSQCPDNEKSEDSVSNVKKSHKLYTEKESPLLAPWHNYMNDDVGAGLSSSAGQSSSDSVGLSASSVSTSSTVTRTSSVSPVMVDSGTDDNLSLSSSPVMFSSQFQYPGPFYEPDISFGSGRKEKKSPNRRASRNRGDTQPDRSTSPTDIICLTPEGVAGAGAGCSPQPIDVEMLTPGTRRAVSHVQQVQTDEEMARKLQEELDREFAMSLQNQHQSQNIAPAALETPDSAESGGRFFSPPMYTPPRTRRRGRPAGAAQRSSRMQAELMELMGGDFLSALAGMEGFDVAAPTGGGRRRGLPVPHLPPAFLGGLMLSPSVAGNDYEFLMNLSEQIGDAKPKGLSKTQTEQLPLIVYKKQDGKTDECNICMTEYEDGDSQKILPCFHTYHAKCINKWISKNATCPVCRVPVKLD